MYLSKIELRKDSLKIFEHLNKLTHQGGYQIHRLIWKLFADPLQPNKKRDFLYRQENQNHWPTFYLLSTIPPVDSDELWQIQTKAYQPQLSTGQKLAFSLRVNPRQVKTTENGKSFRCDAVMDLKMQQGAKTTTYEIIKEAALTWLNKRAQRCGFKVLDALTEGYQQHKLYKPKHLIQFSTVDYQGLLEVVDPTIFVNTLNIGIGAAKSFGCGLMLIKRP